MPVQGPAELGGPMGPTGRPAPSGRAREYDPADVERNSRLDKDIVEISEEAIQLQRMLDALRELPEIEPDRVAASSERLARGELYEVGRLRVAARRILDITAG